MSKVLDGVRVLDLGQIYNGNYCSLLLGFMGAEVIKIESPQGENLRKRTSGEAIDSYSFAMLNSNKKGVTLNLKTEEGKEIFFRLAKEADVIVENFAVGVMDRLGVGYEKLKEINPKIIFASGKGYGSSGPYSQFLAMDLTIQAMSGVMSVTGFPDGPPMKAGPALADFSGGIHLAAGVLGALFSRERTGEGQLVEVSMHDCIYPSLTSQLEAYFRTNGEAPERTGNRHGGLSTAPYNVYETKDGHVAIICVNNKHWDNLCGVMNREDITTKNPKYDSNMKRVAHIDFIDQTVNDWTLQFTKHEIHQILIKAHVPCSPVLTLQEVANDTHYLERGMIQEIEHPQKGKIRVPTSPIQFPEAEKIKVEPAPLLGQHNEEIYNKYLGFDEYKIQYLRESGII